MIIDNLDSAIADLPNFRKRQIYRAIFKNLYHDWGKATDLSLDLRSRLSENLPLTINSKLLVSSDRRTVKALIALPGNLYTETVLIKSKARNTVCLSTQVGCPMGCPFCVSGRYGLTRNLMIGEIVEQVILFSRLLSADGEKIDNIVFMGIGEPFLNYKNVIAAIRFLNRNDTLNLSARRFSISTAGLLPGIEKLSNLTDLQINLAVSLHSAINKKRNVLVPINNKYPLADLSGALKTYFYKTKRKIMIEYLLIKDVNMSEDDAIALRNYLNTINAAYTVNLVPLNETYCDYEVPSGSDISDFKSYLKRYKVNFIQRCSFGKNIGAACGQLAGREKSKKSAACRYDKITSEPGVIY